MTVPHYKLTGLDFIGMLHTIHESDAKNYTPRLMLRVRLGLWLLATIHCNIPIFNTVADPEGVQRVYSNSPETKLLNFHGEFSEKSWENDK